MKKLSFYLLLICLLLAGSGCTKHSGFSFDPAQDEFYYMTRLIMTSEEIEIYKHLPDSQSRKEFAREFWERRDPDPSSEENEALMEFQKRIQFANRWFNERAGHARGWDSLRGRILLQLGFPDERKTGNSAFAGDHLERRYAHYETWVYYEYQMQLIFVDKKGFGQFEFYGRIPAMLSEAISQSKSRMLSSGSGRNKNSFRFQAVSTSDGIEISIPSKRVSFVENHQQLSAQFEFTCYIYRNYVASHSLNKKLDFSQSTDEVINSKELTFSIPLSLPEKGEYFIDIIGKDEQSGERWRTFCKFRK